MRTCRNIIIKMTKRCTVYNPIPLLFSINIECSVVPIRRNRCLFWRNTTIERQGSIRRIIDCNTYRWCWRTDIIVSTLNTMRTTICGSSCYYPWISCVIWICKRTASNSISFKVISKISFNCWQIILNIPRNNYIVVVYNGSSKVCRSNAVFPSCECTFKPCTVASTAVGAYIPVIGSFSNNGSACRSSSNCCVVACCESIKTCWSHLCCRAVEVPSSCSFCRSPRAVYICQRSLFCDQSRWSSTWFNCYISIVKLFCTIFCSYLIDNGSIGSSHKPLEIVRRSNKVVSELLLYCCISIVENDCLSDNNRSGSTCAKFNRNSVGIVVNCTYSIALSCWCSIRENGVVGWCLANDNIVDTVVNCWRSRCQYREFQSKLCTFRNSIRHYVWEWYWCRSKCDICQIYEIVTIHISEFHSSICWTACPSNKWYGSTCITTFNRRQHNNIVIAVCCHICIIRSNCKQIIYICTAHRSVWCIIAYMRSVCRVSTIINIRPAISHYTSGRISCCSVVGECFSEWNSHITAIGTELWWNPIRLVIIRAVCANIYIIRCILCKFCSLIACCIYRFWSCSCELFIGKSCSREDNIPCGSSSAFSPSNISRSCRDIVYFNVSNYRTSNLCDADVVDRCRRLCSNATIVSPIEYHIV